MSEGVGILERIDEAVTAAEAIDATAAVPLEALDSDTGQDPIPPDAIMVTPEDQKDNPVTAHFAGSLITARVAGVMKL